MNTEIKFPPLPFVLAGVAAHARDYARAAVKIALASQTVPSDDVLRTIGATVGLGPDLSVAYGHALLEHCGQPAASAAPIYQVFHSDGTWEDVSAEGYANNEDAGREGRIVYAAPVAAQAAMRDELNRLGMIAHAAMNQDARDQRNILEDLADQLLTLGGGAAHVAAQAQPTIKESLNVAQAQPVTGETWFVRLPTGSAFMLAFVNEVRGELVRIISAEAKHLSEGSWYKTAELEWGQRDKPADPDDAWEPEGLLGHDADHAALASPEDTQAVKDILAQPIVNQSLTADERVAFEWWASDAGTCLEAVERSGSGYKLASIESYWHAWQARAALAQQPSEQNREDAKRLDFLRDECCDLRCVTTGEDDYDWVVIEHYMAKPHEREIGRGPANDPRQAIDAARAAKERT